MPALLYNTGRIVTYATLGLVFGLTGRIFFESNFQQAFSIALGIVILLLLIQQLFFKQLFMQLSVVSSLYRTLQSFIFRLLQSKKPGSCFLLGAANGLLSSTMW